MGHLSVQRESRFPLPSSIIVLAVFLALACAAFSLPFTAESRMGTMTVTPGNLSDNYFDFSISSQGGEFPSLYITVKPKSHEYGATVARSHFDKAHISLRAGHNRKGYVTGMGCLIRLGDFIE